MPREFGQLDAAAWRDDEDWRNLPADSQWLYGLLVSQQDLSAAGVLTLAVSRWTRMCADMSAERMTLALATLEERRFVFVDFDDLELLVRVYARRKTQWANPRRRAAVRNAAAAIHSQRLRAALAVDLSKLDVPGPQVADDVAAILAALPTVTASALATYSPEGTPERLPVPFGKDIAEPDPDVSATRSRACAPQTPDAIRTEAQTPEADTAASPPTPKRGSRIPEPFVITDAMRAWSRGEGMRDELVDRWHESFVDFWRAKAGAGGVKLDWESTWRNWMRREVERLPSRARSPSDRLGGHLELIRQLGEEGA